MSWSRRSILLGALATGACGFSPAFGPGAPAARLQGAVQVSEPETRDAFLLTRQIEDRLGRAATPRYLLETDLAIWQERMAVTRNNITTRFNLIGRLGYRLRDAGTSEVLTEGRIDSFTGFSATGSTVATRAAERDARARLAAILADQLVTRLIAAAPDLP